MPKKNYNGIVSATVKRLQLGAGVFFKNYDVASDTYQSAKAAGKCVGATQGGGTFTATPTMRQVEIDGTAGRVKGLADVQSWEVAMQTTFIETSVNTIRCALGASKINTGELSGYTKIEGKMGIDDDDYIENLTWIGFLSGSDKPIMIQLYNGLNESGLTYAVADDNEGNVPATFYGYNNVADFIEDVVEPPFAIYYPNENSSVYPSAATFDLNEDGENNKNVVVSVVGTVTAVSNGASALTSSDYSFDATTKKLTIYRSYLETLTAQATPYSLTLTMTDAVHPVIKITVVNTGA